MGLCQVMLGAFLLSLAVSGSYANNYGYKGYGYQKIVVYGKDKVVLPTIKNIFIVFSELYLQSLDYLPKEIRDELKSLAYELQSLSVDTKKLISEAKYILKRIENGYIKDPCDILSEIRESLYLLVDILSSCSSDYTYYYKHKLI